MKIAVTGPNGQLGSELVRQGGIPINGRLMSEEMTANIKAIKPDAIINCAALTDVDYCERNIHQAAIVNADGVQYLSKFDGYLIQISTDYVFDGASGPYDVRDAPSPINIYGWSKLGGELVIHRRKGSSLIIRTTILFGTAKNNFVAKIVEQLKTLGDISRGAKVALLNPDITGTPTYVPSLAAEIIRMTKENYTGVAHAAGNPCISRLEFARKIASSFGYDPENVVPNYGPADGAERPQRAGLVCDHDGYRPIRTHNYIEGLLELSRKR